MHGFVRVFALVHAAKPNQHHDYACVRVFALMHEAYQLTLSTLPRALHKKKKCCPLTFQGVDGNNTMQVWCY